MPTKNISMTQPQSDYIDHLVKTGRYQNASEACRDGITLIRMREEEHAAKLAALRAAVKEGFDAYDRGEYVEVLDVAAYMRELGERATRLVDAIHED